MYPALRRNRLFSSGQQKTLRNEMEDKAMETTNMQGADGQPRPDESSVLQPVGHIVAELRARVIADKEAAKTMRIKAKENGMWHLEGAASGEISLAVRLLQWLDELSGSDQEIQS